MCGLHTHLAHWEQAIPWCEKSIAGIPEVYFPYVDLAAAYAWAGHDKEAKETAAQLQKVHPGFTVQTWAARHMQATIRPSTRNTSASSKACARRACQRARRRRIEPARCGSRGIGFVHDQERLVAFVLEGHRRDGAVVAFLSAAQRPRELALNLSKETLEEGVRGEATPEP